MSARRGAGKQSNAVQCFDLRMTLWLKQMYMRDGNRDRDYWENLNWVSDSPGRSFRQWSYRGVPYRGEARPPWGPKYEIGDLLVVALTSRRKDYWKGDSIRCPAILRVESVPCWEPERVEEESDDPDESHVRAVVTIVSNVHAVDLAEAPSLDNIGAHVASIRHGRGRIKLSDEQFERAQRLIGNGISDSEFECHPTVSGASDTAPQQKAPKPTVERVPIERMYVEGYESRSPGDSRQAIRNEQGLLLEYVKQVRETAGAPVICRFKILTEEGSGRIFCDAFNVTRNQLIEAKAAADRESIRMAIGQLADYARHLPGQPGQAILLPERPCSELAELLKANGIASVWRRDDGFVDDSDGAYT